MWSLEFPWPPLHFRQRPNSLLIPYCPFPSELERSSCLLPQSSPAWYRSMTTKVEGLVICPLPCPRPFSFFRVILSAREIVGGFVIAFSGSRSVPSCPLSCSPFISSLLHASPNSFASPRTTPNFPLCTVFPPPHLKSLPLGR